VPFSSYLTLNNIVTLKSGLEVFKIIKLVPFESLGAVSYSPSIVTMVLSYIVCEIRCSDLLVQNREILIPHLYLAPPQGVTPSEFCEDV